MKVLEIKGELITDQEMSHVELHNKVNAILREHGIRFVGESKDVSEEHKDATKYWAKYL